MKKLLLSFSLFSIGLAANAQFTEQATNFTTPDRSVRGIRILNATTVWASAYDAVPISVDHPEPDNVQDFTRTIDGGTTWTRGTIDIGDPSLSVTDISPVSADVAWVGAFQTANEEGLGGVLKTIDGGVTWELQNATAYQTSGESWFNWVYFWDANNGITQGDPEGGDFEIYKTADGGDSWTRVTAANIPNPATEEYGYTNGYVVVGDTIWFITDKGKIYRSSDRGVTWVKKNGPAGLTDFGGEDINGTLNFSSATNGIIIGTLNGTDADPTYTLWKTTDGGDTWDAGVSYTAGYLNVSYVPGTNTLVGTGVVSNVPSTAYSVDNGTTWTEVDSGTERTSITFLDNTLGWAGGFNTSETEGGIFKFSGALGNQQFTSNSFKVYPNPATSIVTISAEQLDSYSIKVTDITGKVMMAKELSGIENTVDVSNYATGLYFFEIKSGSKSETIKIMKN